MKDYMIMEINVFGAVNGYQIENTALKVKIHGKNIKAKATAEFIMNHKLADKSPQYLDQLIRFLDRVFLTEIAVFSFAKKKDMSVIGDEMIYNKQLVDYIAPEILKFVENEVLYEKRMEITLGKYGY